MFVSQWDYVRVTFCQCGVMIYFFSQSHYVGMPLPCRIMEVYRLRIPDV